MTVSMVRPEPQMLRPTSRQYPVDEVCAQIAQALEARDWDIPGLKVEFHTYGSGEALFRTLYKVSSRSFALEFHRNQGLIEGWYDTAAISRIVILKRDLELYSDESGPSLHEYVGEDWRKDRKRFFDGSYRFYGELKNRYIEFEAECHCGGGVSNTHRHTGRRSPLLVQKLDGDKRYQTNELLKEFAGWLTVNVLALIEKFPEKEPDYSRFTVADIPFPTGMPDIFCFADNRDAERVRQADLDMSEIPLRDRYGLQTHSSWVDMGVRDKHHPHDEAFREGAVWCGFGSVDAASVIRTSSRDEAGLSIAGHYPHDKEFIFRVTPNRANDIYVVDHAPYLARRKEVTATLGDREQFTKQEIQDMYLASARTMVPITEYDGSFEQPVVLVQRELGFDEVEIVAGPMSEHLKKYWREQRG